MQHAPKLVNMYLLSHLIEFPPAGGLSKSLVSGTYTITRGSSTSAPNAPMTFGRINGYLSGHLNGS